MKGREMFRERSAKQLDAPTQASQARQPNKQMVERYIQKIAAQVTESNDTTHKSRENLDSFDLSIL